MSDISRQPGFASSRPQRPSLGERLRRIDDGSIVRLAFRALLCGAIGVLAFDLREMAEANGGLFPTETASVVAPSDPVLPPAVETANMPEQSTDPREFVLSDEDLLRNPMRFVLQPGGVMLAEGSIDQGASARLARELEERGEYVRRMTINSPGGSLDDAIAMAKLVRDRGIDTEVPDGALCASSCPLLLAGGVRRVAGEKAAIGVHQFYAVSAKPLDPAQAMADAQMTTARISRHLKEMGVDPQMWIYALDTPPRSLYYFSREQLADYALVTGAPHTAALR
jgi:hypothetical protein